MCIRDSVDIAQKVPNSDYIDSDKIRDIGDNTHLNVTGQLILGMRYAQKILDKVYDRKIIPTMPESRPESPAKRYPIEFCGDRLAPEYFAIVIGDRIFIPATKIFELLGAEIVWNYPVQQADVTAQNLHVTFGIGNENAAINGAPSALDVAPVIINEKAMVPAEFVEECFPVKAQLLENDIFSIARL